MATPVTQTSPHSHTVTVATYLTDTIGAAVKLLPDLDRARSPQDLDAIVQASAR